jgi:uncharacterized protein (DUF1810 family)
VSDPYHLRRFEAAQDPLYEDVVQELTRGQKRTHWMWFVFPQIEGLARSPTAQAFAVASLAEAKAYLKHPVLGTRLRACTQLVLNVEGRTAEQIFGPVDALKFRSSMTLFSRAATAERVFSDALLKYFAGEPDQRTLAMLSR